MNTPPNNVAPITKTIELPEPGYPMLTQMISHALFPDMTSGICRWSVDQPHPLVPEMKVVRMFVVDGGVHVYSAPNSGICTRSFVPMKGIKITEEVMPLDVFVEELARTVNPNPGSPVIGRMVSNSFSKKDDTIVWIVGQPHPYPLSGVSLKVLRILVEEDVAAIYSVSNDGNSGTRHYIPIEQIRFAEESMAPALFANEMEAAENGNDEDPEPEPGEPEEPEDLEPVEVEPKPASPSPNGSQTAPS